MSKDGSVTWYPPGGDDPAQCTRCRQGAGNDCAHFTARQWPPEAAP